jgi:D-inositol-3-phosphate glycosyltransferase
VSGGPGASHLREAMRRHIPLAVRAQVMRIARRLVLGANAPPPGMGTGGFDSPREATTGGADVIRVTGWAIREGRMASTVDVRLDGVLLGHARLGLDRSDLPALGPDAVVAGFELTAALPDIVVGQRAALTATAHFEGRRYRLAIDGPTVRIGSAPLPSRALLALEPPPRSTSLVRAGDDRRAHVLAVTHQLDLGGGQLYLQDLLRGLARTGRYRLTVASPMDGPLRAELEKLGCRVHILATWPHGSLAAYEGRLDELTAWAREGGVDAIVANTIASFPAVHLAGRLGVPVIWAIHESYPLPVLFHAMFGGQADPAVRAAAEMALEEADHLVFEAEATRAIYAPRAGADRCLLVPYGVEIATLDAAMAGLDRATSRQRLGVFEAARLLLCVGTFEPRKAQTLLVRAFCDIADLHPAAQLVLVGDNGTPYAGAVRRLAEGSGLGRRIRIEPVGPDILPWYAAADVLVSASDVESMPRSALEAMALGTPVLAADAYGVTELIDDGVTGWFVAQRDLEALAAGLDRVLGMPAHELASVGRRAAAYVRRQHDASGYITAYGRLLDDLLAHRAAVSKPSAGG